MSDTDFLFEPSSLDFGEVEVGATSAPQSATLENAGDEDATGLTFTLSGSSDFDADTSACPDTLAASASCTVSATFTPNESGPADATLVASSNQGATTRLDLAGHGVSVSMVDDSDPAIEYRRGWHRRRDPSASDGAYHVRLGFPGGREPATARVVFEGQEITYFFGRSEQGGTAEVFLDGDLVQTVDYSGPALRNAPDFGHAITFIDLDEGGHELLIAHRSGAVYVDGFEIVSR